MTVELNALTKMHCQIISSMFKQAVYRNIDINALAEFLMTSDYGIEIMTDVRMSEYAADTFMLEGLVREGKINTVTEPKYSDFEAWFAGYLYKYWHDTRQTDPREIYKIAPTNEIADSFPFIHTQGWEYVIEHLIDKKRGCC